jgi:hypothetical protein
MFGETKFTVSYFQKITLHSKFPKIIYTPLQSCIDVLLFFFGHIWHSARTLFQRSSWNYERNFELMSVNYFGMEYNYFGVECQLFDHFKGWSVFLKNIVCVKCNFIIIWGINIIYLYF